MNEFEIEAKQMIKEFTFGDESVDKLKGIYCSLNACRRLMSYDIDVYSQIHTYLLRELESYNGSIKENGK